jgi:hypothetical protein
MGNNGVCRGQVNRHASCPSGHETLLTASLCRTAGFLYDLCECCTLLYVLLVVYHDPQEMTQDGEIVNVCSTKSVIASKAAFTYEKAQIRKDDPCVSKSLANNKEFIF